MEPEISKRRLPYLQQHGRPKKIVNSAANLQKLFNFSRKADVMRFALLTVFVQGSPGARMHGTESTRGCRRAGVRTPHQASASQSAEQAFLTRPYVRDLSKQDAGAGYQFLELSATRLIEQPGGSVCSSSFTWADLSAQCTTDHRLLQTALVT